jgi:hypothetical protein
MYTVGVGAGGILFRAADHGGCRSAWARGVPLVARAQAYSLCSPLLWISLANVRRNEPYTALGRTRSAGALIAPKSVKRDSPAS